MVANESRQKVMKIIGEYGCYYLAVIHLAEELTKKRIDAIDFFVQALEKKWVDHEATMLQPAEILGNLTKNRFIVVKEDISYQPKNAEYEILLFENGNYCHFVLGDGTGKVAYDPLGVSNTVANGKLAGKRIFRKV